MYTCTCPRFTNSTVTSLDPDRSSTSSPPACGSAANGAGATGEGTARDDALLGLASRTARAQSRPMCPPWAAAPPAVAAGARSDPSGACARPGAVSKAEPVSDGAGGAGVNGLTRDGETPGDERADDTDEGARGDPSENGDTLVGLSNGPHRLPELAKLELRLSFSFVGEWPCLATIPAELPLLPGSGRGSGAATFLAFR
mmetsp:Transcript_88288/g.201868  ORF Transcript_88288/g.201868 Transcript_88288/m.201868 type:complete len:200 (+) Transcript_88288:170-769(+)